MKKTVPIEYLQEHFTADFENGILYKNGEPVGNKVTDGYVHVYVNSTSPFKVHRVLWALAYGYWPTLDIDHINGIRDDNRLSNLRECTRADNARNRNKANKNSKSGVTGVFWHKLKRKWEARIGVNGSTVYLGAFIDKDDAIAARKEEN